MMESRNCFSEVKRDGAGRLQTITDLVYSPDDGGHYFSQADFPRKRGRVSADVFPTEHEALAAFRSNKVKWEAWS